MNVVATKTTIVVIESEENHKKIVATQKRMLRHNNIVTKENYIVTIKATQSEISVAIENFFVATENGR